MKKCSKCKAEKPIDQFAKRSDRPRGVQSHCKICQYRAHHIYKTSPEGREYSREYSRYYRKTETGKEIYKRHLDRMKARGISKVHNIFKYAVRRGEVVKQPCVRCGEKKSFGHHDDYSKPLDVIWLCALHHRERHTFYNKHGVWEVINEIRGNSAGLGNEAS